MPSIVPRHPNQADTTVLVVGDITIDIIASLRTPLARTGSDHPSDIQVRYGGQGANCAAWLTYYQTRTSLTACVGADAAGDAAITRLQELGVDCSGVQRAEHMHTGTVVAISDPHDRTFLTDRGANDHLTLPYLPYTPTPGATHLHLSGYTLLTRSTRRQAVQTLHRSRERNWTVSLDLASVDPLRDVPRDEVASWLQYVDIVFANTAEAFAYTKTTHPADAATALASPTRTAVVKAGPKGAWYCSPPTRPVHIPTTAIRPARDTTGAGDAFAAGLLHALLQGATIDQALHHANKAGAVAVSILGGMPPIPTTAAPPLKPPTASAHRHAQSS